MDNEKYNKLIHDLQQDMNIPDSTPSWNALQPRLEKRRRKKRLYKRIKIVSGLVSASFLISIFIGIQDTTKAYANLSTLLKSIQNNIVEIFIKKPPAEDPQNALTLPPPKIENEEQPVESSHVVSEKVSLEEAQEKLSFSLLLPANLPGHIQLVGVKIFREMDDQYRYVYLEYEDNQGALIKISQRAVTENSGIKAEIHEGNGTIHDVLINGSPGMLMVLPEGMINLEWMMSDIKIAISGVLSEAAAIEWAESLQ